MTINMKQLTTDQLCLFMNTNLNELNIRFVPSLNLFLYFDIDSMIVYEIIINKKRKSLSEYGKITNHYYKNK